MTRSRSKDPARLVGAARREDGYTILIALVVLIVTLALATVAVTETLDSRSHATRDLRSQRALQAADAGINSGVYRLDQVDLTKLNFTGGLLGGFLGTLADCVIPQTNISGQITAFTLQAQASLATGACKLPDQSGLGNAIADTVQVGNHAFYEMQQLGGATTTGSLIGPNVVLHPKIVSVGVEDAGNSTTCSASAPTTPAAGTSGCVVRRILASLAPIDPFQVVESTGDLTINGAVTAVTGDMRTNGNLAIPGTVVCVPVCLPAAATLTGTSLLSGGGLTAHVTYGGTLSTAALFVDTLGLDVLTHAANAVNRQAVTINDSGCPAACVLPSLPTGVTATSLGGKNGAANAYDATTNTVTLTSNNLAFVPGDYILCGFNATGGTVATNIPANSTAPVRIFIDSPSSSRCTGLGGVQGSFNSSVGTQNVISGITALTGSAQFQIYVVGNGTPNATTVNIGNLTVTESMFVYAPVSSVTLSALAFEGNLIGDNVSITAATILQNLGLNNYSLANNVGAFHVAQYNECTPVYPLPQPDPTVGC